MGYCCSRLQFLGEIEVHRLLLRACLHLFWRDEE